MTSARIPLRDVAMLTAEMVMNTVRRGKALIDAGDFNNARYYGQILGRTRAKDVLNGMTLDRRVIEAKIADVTDVDLPARIMYDTMLTFYINYALGMLNQSAHQLDLINDAKDKLVRFEGDSMCKHFTTTLDQLVAIHSKPLILTRAEQIEMAKIQLWVLILELKIE
mgnify:CR=1 FL=1